MRQLVSALLLLAAIPLFAQQPAQPASEEKSNEKNNAANLMISLDPLGDSDAGVVARVTFRFTIPEDVPPQGLALQGSMLQNGDVVRNFRFVLAPNQRDSARTIVTLQPGPVE